MTQLVRRILKVLNRHGLWDEGVELIGSWCMELYEHHFKLPPYPLRTQDLDILLPYPYPRRAKTDLVGALEQLGFRCDFRPDGALFLWNADLRIEFLIPERGRGRETAVEVKALSVTALPLRFVDLLLRYPISVVEGGIKVQIPDPAAFCLHKLIIANRRKQAASREKDLEQAVRVGGIADRALLKHIYRELPKAWQRLVLKGLERAREQFLLREQASELLGTLQTLK